MEEVERVLERVDKVDYVSFVPDGEPLLDIDVGREIRGLKSLGLRVAVLTNASLLYDPGARQDLVEADYVSVKIDAVTESVWRAVNRPHGLLRLDEVLTGIRDFSREFRGVLTTETMLVEGFNTEASVLEKTAEFIKGLRPQRAYIAAPVRPPAEPYVRPPTPETIVRAYSIFSERLGEGVVETLTSLEPPPPPVHGDPRQWLLSVVSVHPLKYEYAVRSLERLVEDPERLIVSLEKEGLVARVYYNNTCFITRRVSVSQEQASL